MIEFSGEISDEVMDKLIKREYFFHVIAGLIATVIPSIPIVLFSIFLTPLIYLFLIVPIIVFISIIIDIKVNVKKFAPVDVKIEDKEIEITQIRLNVGTCRTFDDIHKIIDYGDYYRIVFYLFSGKIMCICEKANIKQGSIEEFEELFKDYIVRKIK